MLLPVTVLLAAAAASTLILQQHHQQQQQQQPSFLTNVGSSGDRVCGVASLGDDVAALWDAKGRGATLARLQAGRVLWEQVVSAGTEARALRVRGAVAVALVSGRGGFALVATDVESRAVLWRASGGPGASARALDATRDADAYAVVGATDAVFAGPQRGGGDAVVALVRSGNSTAPLWAAQFGTPWLDSALAVAVSPKTNSVVVVGTTEGDLVHGTNDSRSADAFVVSFDADGRERWRIQRGSRTSVSIAMGVAVSTSSSGLVFVTGFSADAFGTDDESGGAFLLVLAGDSGAVVRQEMVGPLFRTVAQALVLAPNDTAVIAGYTMGSVTERGRVSAGGDDAFVLSTAEQALAFQYGTAGDDSVELGGLALVNKETVLIAGNSAGVPWVAMAALRAPHDGGGQLPASSPPAYRWLGGVVGVVVLGSVWALVQGQRRQGVVGRGEEVGEQEQEQEQLAGGIELDSMDAADESPLL